MRNSMCALALLAGCAGMQPVDDHGAQSGETQGTSGTTEPGGDTGSGSASCSLGVGSYEAVIGASNVTQTLDVAVDRLGHAFVAGMTQDRSVTQIAGVFEVSQLGGVKPLLAVGSLVASDGAGNVIVAGTTGMDDLVIAKIERGGRVILVKQLDLCGSGLVGLAADHDGRIAVSGSALGTVVLTPTGDEMFDVTAVGHLAFDSKGHLVIASSTGFDVTKIDRGGRVLAAQSYTGTGSFSGVAVDASDHVLLVGTTPDRVSFDGTEIIARFAGEAGRITGGFLVELDPRLMIVVVRDLVIVEANGVAVDVFGNELVAGAITIDTPPFRAIDVLSLDTRGVVTVVETGLAAPNGRAFAVAADLCGAIYAAVVHVPSPSAGTQAELLKISQ